MHNELRHKNVQRARNSATLPQGDVQAMAVGHIRPACFLSCNLLLSLCLASWFAADFIDAFLLCLVLPDLHPSLPLACGHGHHLSHMLGPFITQPCHWQQTISATGCCCQTCWEMKGPSRWLTCMHYSSWATAASKTNSSFLAYQRVHLPWHRRCHRQECSGPLTALLTFQHQDALSRRAICARDGARLAPGRFPILRNMCLVLRSYCVYWPRKTAAGEVGN